MVMVLFSDNTINLEGKVGGEYWRHDQSLEHLQAMPRVIRGRGDTPQQKAFNRCSIAWSNFERTREQLDLWWTWIDNHPVKNKKGETILLIPYTAFLHINIPRILAGKEIITTPPA